MSRIEKKTGADIRSFNSMTPVLKKDVYVDSASVIIGDVILEECVSIWPNVVLRGDQGRIHIGARTNIQDGTIAHATGGFSTVDIGSDCTVGHRVLLHGCTVEDACLIGMGAILLDNCVIGTGSIVGAGALVTSGCHFPAGSLILGSPAKVVRPLKDGEHEHWIEHGRDEYLRLADLYRDSKENNNE